MPREPGDWWLISWFKTI